MKPLLFLLFIFISDCCFSQTAELLQQNKVVVFKDYRLDILQQKEAELNTATFKRQAHTAQGYRLMILNTSDKDYAFKVRAELLQKFPEQKPYMWYANPYIRIKFGNFKTKEEADVYKNQISKMLGGANIYYLSESIEVTPDKDYNGYNIK
ncbi:MAG: SPOR domain-containing protein [Ginsengibacter sp.]